MSYTYKIVILKPDPLIQGFEKLFPDLKRQRDDINVNEILNGKIKYTWNIEELKINSQKFTKIFSQSFKRTKKWVIENHPELLI
jgi:hypothetical protein